MAYKSVTLTCNVTTDWEWMQTGTTPTSTTTTRQEVTTSQRWKYDALYDTWAKDGPLQYTGTNFVETVAPPYPGGSAQNGATITTNGKGMADVTTTTGGDPIYGWGEQRTVHNHPSQYYYDDGTYAGYLPFQSCTGTRASQPSYSGTLGQTATTSSSATATYSGDAPLKDTGGGTPTRPSNWSWTSLVSSIPFSSTYIVGGVRKGNLVNATEWNNFTARINEFRSYKGLGAYTFTSVSSQQSMTQAIYNEAVNAITPMKTVSQPTGFYSKLIALRDALNSIT